jgi:hypothetical protein
MVGVWLVEYDLIHKIVFFLAVFRRIVGFEPASGAKVLFGNGW